MERKVRRSVDPGICWTTFGRWGGSRIVRFSPQGNIDAEIHFPTALNVTACCFGGGQLTWSVLENDSHFVVQVPTRTNYT